MVNNRMAGSDSGCVSQGTRCKIAGLKGAPQHNGAWGQVVGYDRVAGRYEVKLEAQKHLKLKPGNVVPG